MERLEAWVMSTAHVEPGDLERLEDSCHEHDALITSWVGYYGAMVVLPEWSLANLIKLRRYGFSKMFLQVLAKARQNHWKYVVFDRDGDTYDELDQYDW